MQISQIRRKTLPILRRYKVARAGLFGSAARGTMTRDSDIDILVQLPKSASLLALVGLKLSIQKALGKAVDVVEYSTLRSPARRKILKEEVALL
ncbi:MAG: nucleotidyltransferase family protein [Candidatus Micrarchaeota archaeon]